MKRKLTKSRNNVVLTGALAGIAEYIGIDPTVVRIIYVFLFFAGLGSPIILYILLAVLIPSDTGQRQSYGHNNPYYKNNSGQRASKRKEAEKVDDDEWSDF